MAYDAGRWGAGEKWVWLGEEGQAGSSAFRFLPFFFPRFSVGSGSATFSANCVGWGAGCSKWAKRIRQWQECKKKSKEGVKHQNAKWLFQFWNLLKLHCNCKKVTYTPICEMHASEKNPRQV